MDDFQTPSPSRTVTLVGTLAPATQGNDFGGYGIYIQLGSTHLVSDQATLVRTFECSWPEEEDAVRLQDNIKAMRLRLRLHAEYLRECGGPIFRTANKSPGLGWALAGLVFAALWALAEMRQGSAS